MKYVYICFYIFFFKQKTAYEMRISDWSSDVCSSDLIFVHQALFVRVGRHAVDQAMDRIDDRVERVVVARRRHPRRERARAALVKSVEGQIDDLAHIAFAGRRFGHFPADRKSTRLNSSH